MTIQFVFDVESNGLHGEGFAYGYVVVRTHEDLSEPEILEEGECYSIQGAKDAASVEWVKDNVLPKLDKLTPYLQEATIDPSSLSNEIVMTTRELREKFYQVYTKWKEYKEDKVEFWSDVNFPVETNFLHAIVKDGEGARDWSMPFPLRDVANFVDLEINRKEYSKLPDLKEHNPRDDAKASAFSLHRYKVELSVKNKSVIVMGKEASSSIISAIQNSGSPVFVNPTKSLENIQSNQNAVVDNTMCS